MYSDCVLAMANVPPSIDDTRNEATDGQPGTVADRSYPSLRATDSHSNSTTARKRMSGATGVDMANDAEEPPRNG